MRRKILVLTTSFVLFMLSVSHVFAEKSFNINVPLPGKSIANPKLQYDSLMGVYAAVGAIDQNCDNFSVIDTAVIVSPQNLVSKNDNYVAGDWKELWTVNYCGKNAQVPIKFILDEQGATYLLNPSEISPHS